MRAFCYSSAAFNIPSSYSFPYERSNVLEIDLKGSKKFVHSKKISDLCEKKLWNKRIGLKRSKCSRH